MVGFTRRAFQLGVIILVLANHVESHAKSLRRSHSVVKQQRESQLVLAYRVPQVFGVVRANAHDLKTQFVQRFCVLAQLDQLLDAMASPTAAIENQHSGLLCNNQVQVDRLIVNPNQCQIGNRSAYQERSNRFHVIGRYIGVVCHRLVLHNRCPAEINVL